MTEPLKTLPVDVISIQSQVVYGCVGNSVAVPTLQKMGLNVVPVPTVMFSNTPHYPTLYGGALSDDWFSGYLQGLHDRGVTEQAKAILVGYMGGPSQAGILAEWLTRLIAVRPDIQVIIDPVIGDYDTGIYVNPLMTAAYLDRLLPLARGMTPNCFELELLTGRQITDINSVIAAARTLLTGRTQWVVVTSAAPGSSGGSENELRVIMVTRQKEQVFSHPRIAIYPKGTGDLFSAALTGYLLKNQTLPAAIEGSYGDVMATLERTRRYGYGELLLHDR
ncbi:MULTISPECIES: pyridoxine/pyridoxal/pyridoxamine kinase [Sodalis]|jgi:pyridoxine kinase|uniref:pyridoxal kinase n=1 Tax=Sodalis ligni TaxID=2697027 RepID=A0A4V2Q2L8_9GAMM|nr:pyridoxal kinase [Sodalis ligni]